MGQIHATQSRNVLTATLQSGERFPALLVSQSGEEVRLYDLTETPPVLRTFVRSQMVSLVKNPGWRHDDFARSYAPEELEDIVAYLRWAATEH